MKKLILDSGILNAYMNRNGDVFGRLRAEVATGVRIGTCIPVVGELVFGIELTERREKDLEILIRNLETMRVWPFDQLAATTYGRLAADLRRRGRPMQTIDVMLASVAMNLGDCTVITTDTDLEAIPGLSVQRW